MRVLLTVTALCLAAAGLTATGSAAAEPVTAEALRGPTDGLTLWLDASSVNAADGVPVGGWQDRSSRSNDVGQSDENRQPVFRASALGGRPALQFLGGQYLERADFNGFAANDQAFHIVIVFQAPAGGGVSQRLIDLQSIPPGAARGDNQRGFWVGFQQSRYIPRLGIVNGDEGEAVTPIWDGQPHLLELVYRGNQEFEIHVDGRTERKASYGGRKFLGFGQRVSLAVGQHSGHADHAPTYLNGDVAEVLTYQRPLTKAERFDLGTLLTQKYSLKTSFRSLPRFERDIRPLLAAGCFSCHGEDQQEAGLDLRSVSSMLAGGEAGPVIVRGHPEFSELVAVLEAGKMPPDDAKPLNRKQIALIRDWIEADAPASEQVVIRPPQPKVTAKDREHWAWQMPVRPELPAVQQTEQVRSEIDRFVLARLQKKGLSLSADARPERLVRRLYFDLIGLPPSPQEVDAFVGAESPRAYEDLVDDLLASPHFGERWARHWLDVAGYVDVFGSDNDAAIIKPLAGKWRYRDYMIRSFNDDKPIDQFLIEQLAGDQLADWKQADRFSPETLDRLTATAFLLSANDDTNAPELNTPDVRHHVLQRTAENVASSLFAVTLECARCHDHKYEAISQVDYYRFQSVFAPVFNVRDWVVSDQRTRADVAPARQAEIDRHNGGIDAQIKPLQAEADKLKDAESESDKARRQELTTQIAQLNSQKQSYGSIPIATNSSSAATTHVLRRGDYLRPGLEVDPALFEILRLTNGESADDETVSFTRLALAREITSPESLAGLHVARVFVNRIWQQLFGTGLVASSDNLGASGTSPSHPELLDWLTLQFIEDGWRVKPLIRRLVTCSTYRQTASVPAGPNSAQRIDPSNRLLWRMNLRRLDSEQLRDAMLTVSGQLDRSVGGPPIPLDPRPNGMVVINHARLPTGTTANRRSVYILARRNYHLTFMRVFDQPIVARNCTGRSPSAVVTQSLTLLHDEFVLSQADHLADRVLSEVPDGSDSALTQIAWTIVTGRQPDAEEESLSTGLLDRDRQRFEQNGDPDLARRQALARLCHMLLNTNEFLYVP